MLNRANYKTEEAYLAHKAAYARLNQAILYEEIGNYASARTGLVMACHAELQALGFVSVLQKINQSVPKWSAESIVLAHHNRVHRK